MNLNKSVQIKLLNLPQYCRRLVILLLDIVLIIASIYPNINRLTVNQNEQLSSYQWLLISPVICIVPPDKEFSFSIPTKLIVAPVLDEFQ